MRQEELVQVFSKVMNKSNIIVDTDQMQRLVGKMFEPDILLFPHNVDEIAQIMKIANKYKLTIYPVGSGSRFTKGVTAFKSGVLLSTTNLNKVIEYRPDNMSIEVEAGITSQILQEKLAEDNIFYPIDTENMQSTIGGQIATNSYGRKKYLYKSTRFHVMGMEFVSPQGEVIRVGGRTVKNVSGYDISQLLAGSWGNFGIITKATLKVRPLPEKNIKMHKPVNNLSDLAKEIEVVMAEKLSLASLIFKQMNNKFMLQIELEGFADTLLLQAKHLKEKLGFHSTEEKLPKIEDFDAVVSLNYENYCRGLKLINDLLESDYTAVTLQGNATNGILELKGHFSDKQLNRLKNDIENLKGIVSCHGRLLTFANKASSYVDIILIIKQNLDPNNILVPHSKAIKGVGTHG